MDITLIQLKDYFDIKRKINEIIESCKIDYKEFSRNLGITETELLKIMLNKKVPDEEFIRRLDIIFSAKE